MTARPILFSGPMVRALLDGTKTQTRRVIKLPTKGEYTYRGGWEPTTSGGGGCFTIGRDGERIPAPEEVAIWNQTTGTTVVMPNRPGDLLWVRERGWMSPRKDAFVPLVDNEGQAPTSPQDGAPYKAMPSIHMPRWASRLTLEVTEVRVQRLQWISEADAVAEGIEDVTAEVAPSDQSLRFWKRYRDGGWNGYVDCPVASYASLWTEINGAGSWEADPWIAAYTFTVHRLNVDALLAERGRAAA